jgi:hypothetical protein
MVCLCRPLPPSPRPTHSPRSCNLQPRDSVGSHLPERTCINFQKKYERTHPTEVGMKRAEFQAQSTSKWTSKMGSVMPPSMPKGTNPPIRVAGGKYAPAPAPPPRPEPAQPLPERYRPVVPEVTPAIHRLYSRDMRDPSGLGMLHVLERDTASWRGQQHWHSTAPQPQPDAQRHWHPSRETRVYPPTHQPELVRRHPVQSAAQMYHPKVGPPALSPKAGLVTILAVYHCQTTALNVIGTCCRSCGVRIC